MQMVAPVLAGLDTEPPQAPVLVLGLGNILMMDEGVGVAVVENLHTRYRVPPEVELLDGGTSGMALLDDLRMRKALIVVDAIRTGQPPGTVVVLKDDAVPAFFRSRVSPHQLALSDVLAVLILTGEAPANICVIGVEPLSLETHLGLSDLVEARVEELTMQVVATLDALGYAITTQVEGQTS
ncbi:MAG: HyaD/HybD family hydrogenase maturation endopeptidase [Thiogranum sp.]|nr:HyaD/HybD family hydrogenase maturation endopeptidase [Thiogranum sp.]